MGRPGQVPNMTVQDAARRVGTEAEVVGDPRPLLVDVRERNEFAQLRVPGAVLLPLSELADGSKRLPTDRPLLVMCAAGKRSLAASEFLLHNGWTDVTNVSGGIIAWQAAGLPTTSGPVTPGEGDLPGS